MTTPPHDLDPAVAAHAILMAMPRAVVVTGPDGVIELWNSEAERLFGWRSDEVIGRQIVDVLTPPAEVQASRARLAAVNAGAVTEGDRTVLRRDGQPILISSSARAVYDDTGRVAAIVGVSADVTERRLVERSAQDLSESLRLVLDAAELGTWRWDMGTGTTQWDAKLEEINGLEPGGFDGSFERYVASLHPDDRDRVLATIDHAVATVDQYRIEHRIVRADGEVRWVSCAGQTTVGPEGTATGTIGCVADVTDRVAQDQELARNHAETAAAADRERLQRERFEFLVTINDVLNEAATVEEIMTSVAEAAVPRLGDWCTVHLLPLTGVVPDVAIAHTDPTMVSLAHELRTRFPYDPDATTGIAEVIRSGRTAFYPEIDQDLLEGLDTTAEERGVVEQLGLRSAIAVPIVKRGRVLGAMQFVMSSSSRRYTSDDVVMAELIAARIAASVENRRLIESHRTVARTLQEGLLAGSLPTVPGVDIAVGYWPAGEGAQVGGDFYDVFGIEDDPSTWALVVGDVCGTGPVAASVTGLARHTLRDAAWHGDTPDAMLAALNRSLRRSDFRTFCTAAVAMVRSVGDGIELDVASGGHPLPILFDGERSVRLGEYGTLLGLLPETNSTTVEAVLRPGHSVVFYTDGATDLPPPYGLTEDDFLELVHACALRSDTAQALASAIHEQLDARLGFERRDDDLALLVVRVG